MPDESRVHEPPQIDHGDLPRPAHRDSTAYKLGRCVGALEIILHETKVAVRGNTAPTVYRITDIARDTLTAIGFDPDTNTWIHKP
jgi:hypothetical protein